MPRGIGRRRGSRGEGRATRLRVVEPGAASRSARSGSRNSSAAMKPRVPQIAEAIAHEVGTALGFATKVQAEFPITMIGMNAKFIRERKLEEELGNSLVVKEPIGVVGCMTPWNYPLHQVVCKIAPALAAGCTVVLKPAEMAPLSAFMLAEAAHEIGLPGRRAQHRVGVRPRRRRGDRRVTPMWTWSASPARCRPAGASRRLPAMASRRCVSSSAASRRSSSSTTRRSTRRFRPASTTACRTPGRPARRGRACSCRDRATTKRWSSRRRSSRS